MWNRYVVEVSDYEFEKHVPKLNCNWSVKENEFSFYQGGTGENLAILKQGKDEKELTITTCKKTGWRPDAKKLKDVMKKSMEASGEIYLLVDTTDHTPVFDFITGKELTVFMIRPPRVCTKKDTKCLAIYPKIDSNNVVTVKPVILTSYVEHLGNIAYFKNYGKLLMYSAFEPDIYGAKTVYKAIMTYNDFDPDVSATTQLKDYINPSKSVNKISKFNFTSLDKLFENKVEEETKPLLPSGIAPRSTFLGYLSELINELKDKTVIHSVGNIRLEYILDCPDIENKFPYDLHELYQTWNTIFMTIDREKPRGEWVNKAFEFIEVKKIYADLLGFTGTNIHLFDFKAPWKIEKSKLQ
jgi:hypothetical protein